MKKCGITVMKDKSTAWTMPLSDEVASHKVMDGHGVG
jgi:hypothetical protein